MNTPNPDSGEELPHINTQLFGMLDEENRGVVAGRRSPSTSRATGQAPTMDGFVADYISMLMVELGRQPTVEEYSQIMTGYTPEQMPVLSSDRAGALRPSITGSATCRRAPTPTGRSSTPGQSSGYVVNTSPPGSFPAVPTTPRRCLTGSTRPG